MGDPGDMAIYASPRFFRLHMINFVSIFWHMKLNVYAQALKGVANLTVFNLHLLLS